MRLHAAASSLEKVRQQGNLKFKSLQVVFFLQHIDIKFVFSFF